MDYFKVNFSLSSKAKGYEIELLKGGLLSLGFDAFVDIDDESFEAYIPSNSFDEESIKHFNVRYNVEFIKDENWNKKWEDGATKVRVKDFCLIRKSTEVKEDTVYDIIINPCQSFGTANHPTTYMIIEAISHLDVKGRDVMDMGCGTGVLGILCKKMGARYVESIDIDDWAYNNTLENAKQNDVELRVKHGGSEQISKDKQFDIFFANLNLNILLDNIEAYYPHIKQGGLIVMSGFYRDDIEELLNKIHPMGFRLYSQTTKDSWAIVILIRE